MDKSVELLDFKVPDKHPSFEDHFPGDPIVPGALLVHWVSELLKNANLLDKAEKISSFKFLHKVQPGDEGSLKVDCKEESKIKVTCTIADTVVFKGVFKASIAEPSIAEHRH